MDPNPSSRKEPSIPRPTGIVKRQPELSPELRGRYAKISKADWADLYADLYRQVFGEDETDEAVLQDAEKRLDILKTYRGTR